MIWPMFLLTILAIFHAVASEEPKKQEAVKDMGLQFKLKLDEGWREYPEYAERFPDANTINEDFIDRFLFAQSVRPTTPKSENPEREIYSPMW
ncbi:unnamed protein product [Caenorhabditis angaria]|uniref:Uncharacterized protein n=1 Tax=Caenorhabditis angaria TaxID=860376 RepID=A0A9P1NBB3_9PELO|nr:unnamed protein product [Caenorhabditis angaria]